MAELQALETQQQKFYAAVNAKIQSVVEEAYMKKLSHVFEQSKQVHTLEKRRIYVRFKQFLFQSRILTFHEE